MKVEDIRKIVLPACREFNVRRLDAFGSIARGAATSSSDIDLIVEFSFMKDEILAHLHDILQADRAIKEFILGRTFQQYTSDEMLCSAVERKFEVMGEAINRIRRDEPDVLSQIRRAASGSDGAETGSFEL